VIWLPIVDCHNSSIGWRENRLPESQEPSRRLRSQERPPVTRSGGPSIRVDGDEVDRIALAAKVRPVAWDPISGGTHREPPPSERQLQLYRRTLRIRLIVRRRPKCRSESSLVRLAVLVHSHIVKKPKLIGGTGGVLPSPARHVDSARVQTRGGLGTVIAMEVLVIGGHGKVGLRLLRLLAQEGHRGRGVIRTADQAGDLEEVGAEPVLCDLERGDDLRPHVGSADAIVFAAGAGPGSGPERKRTVDYGAAVKSMDVASELGVSRYVIVSSIGTHDVKAASGAMRPYLQAKRDADDALKQSELDWTIVKPGHLTNAPGTGRVEVSRTFGHRGDVPRDDVALVLLECLQAPNTIGVEFELFEGEIPAREAIRSL
jgi:uncharacterized protein YbjT (DUF2867 family)